MYLTANRFLQRTTAKGFARLREEPLEPLRPGRERKQAAAIKAKRTIAAKAKRELAAILAGRTR